MTALWVGLDLGPNGYSGKKQHFAHPSQAAKAIRSFPLAPSIIVESGRGIHLYWLLKGVVEITNFEEFARLLVRLNTYFQCLKEVGVDSMMRLPGTVNAKLPGEAFDCYVKYLNIEFRYSLEEFQQLNLAVPALESRPPAKSPEAEPRTAHRSRQQRPACRWDGLRGRIHD